MVTLVRNALGQYIQKTLKLLGSRLTDEREPVKWYELFLKKLWSLQVL